MSTSPSGDQDQETAEDVHFVSADDAPDSHINHAAALAYWSSIPPTDYGVLGGHPHVSRVDLQASANFLAKLRRLQSKPRDTGKLKRVADCGAGIGRVTRGFLSKVAHTVDIVEPVKTLSDQIKHEPCVGTVYNVGLEQWTPETQYDLIWHQWCVGQLTDIQLVTYLRSLPRFLAEDGWIVVKENLSDHPLGEDAFDETDSSVTRTDAKFRQLFAKAGLQLKSTVLQKAFPKSLYPVRSYALQPQ